MSDDHDSGARLLPGDVDPPLFRPNPAHARKVIPEKVLADARNLFETTDIPLSEIARRAGLHRSLMHRTVLREGWSRPTPKARKERVAARLRARIEKELCSVEISLAHSRSAAARETARQSADTLASLMRTLRELKRLDLEDEDAPGEAEHEENLDMLRERLALRLETLLAEQQAAEAAGEGGAGG
jgi:transposase-like protein